MKKLIIILSMLSSCLGFAKPAYQIDLILFAYSNQNEKMEGEIPFLPLDAQAIRLKSSEDKTALLYRLLPPSSSGLGNEYYLLSHKSAHTIIGYYSWKQPADNQNPVVLPLMEHNGWHMQGTFNVKQNKFYDFNAELQIAPPGFSLSSLTLSQKQRLKSNVVYYLDNPQVGMLVKIH